MIKVTIKVVLNGRPMSNGKHGIYLRVLKNRQQKKISLGLSCEKQHFKNEQFTRQHPNYQLENEALLKFKGRALKCIRELQVSQNDFSLDEFENALRGIKKNQDILVIDFYDEIIDELMRSGKISNSKVYKDTRDSLKKFTHKSLKFKDITIGFLEKYDAFLRETGSKNGGVSVRMRNLRALYNKARRRNLIPKEPYPFDGYKISKLKSETSKTALTVDELKKIKDVDLSGHPHLLEGYYYFLFSLFTRGMNFHDMMLLKWSDIRSGRIYYTRSKTKGKINLEIIPPVQKILDYFKAQNRPTKYVFPILLSDDLTPQQKFNRKHKISKRYNSKIKEIAKLAGVEKNLTTYVARHSFATILKMKGTPIEKICEMMGHKDVSVTITYLKEFSNEDLDEENRKFMDL